MGASRRILATLRGRGTPRWPGTPTYRAQSIQALQHVIGLGIGHGDPFEELTSPRQVARPVVEVAQRVPLAYVAVRRVPQSLACPGAGEERDGAVQVSPVGQHAGHDEA